MKVQSTILTTVSLLLSPLFLSAEEPQSNTTTEEGDSILIDKNLLLDEVTVSAQRPLVVKEIDRIGYDVQADPEVKTAQLIDILRKVPLVSIDAEGNITVNGSSNFKVYKNGRPNNSFTKNAKELFKAIPATSIKKVEVITDPGAREDAEGVGAILNIITDSNSGLEGFTANLSLYGDTNNPVPTPNLWLSSQIGKVTFSVNGAYFNTNRRESENEGHCVGFYKETGNRLVFDETESSRRNAYRGGFDLSYEPDTMNLVTVSMDAYQNFGNTLATRDYRMENAGGETLFAYNMSSYYPRHQYLDLDGSVNYQRSTRLKGENLTLSYQLSTTRQKQQQQTDYSETINAPFDYSGIASRFDLRFFEHTFQFDWTRPVARRHTLDVGAKYILRRNDSENRRDYIGTERETYDKFNHNTDIGAAYADFRAKFGKVTARAGFRYEYSRLSATFKEGDGTDFSSVINDYVPNASVSYTLNDANTLNLTFNRRISRPGISYLDPTVAVTPNSTSSGNPRLHSAGFNTVLINYSYIKSKVNVYLTASYKFTNDGIAQTMDVVDDHIYYSYANTGRARVFVVSGNGQWTPKDGTQLNCGFYYSFSRQSMPDGTRLTRPCYNPWMTLNQKLPARMKLTCNVGWWSGTTLNAYSYMRSGIAYFWNNFRLQRFFLSDDRLSVGVGLQNPFGPYKRKSHTYTSTPDYYSDMSTCYRHNFAVSLSINYRFGKLNASVKKTGASIENDDLQGRKN